MEGMLSIIEMMEVGYEAFNGKMYTKEQRRGIEKNGLFYFTLFGVEKISSPNNLKSLLNLKPFLIHQGQGILPRQRI